MAAPTLPPPKPRRPPEVILPAPDSRTSSPVDGSRGRPRYSILSPEPTVVVDTPRAQLHLTDSSRTCAHERVARTHHVEPTKRIMRLPSAERGKIRLIEKRIEGVGGYIRDAGVLSCRVAPHDEERSYSRTDQCPCAALILSPRQSS